MLGKVAGALASRSARQQVTRVIARTASTSSSSSSASVLARRVPALVATRPATRVALTGASVFGVGMVMNKSFGNDIRNFLTTRSDAVHTDAAAGEHHHLRFNARLDESEEYDETRFSPLSIPGLAAGEKLSITLYQYEACPFCNKVKAFLDFYQLPYTIVEVNPVSKKEIKFSEYKKVPILVVNDVQINDSTKIVSTLHSIVQSQDDQKRRDAAFVKNEQYWRKWVDLRMVHTLAPNIYRTTAESFQAFEYISDQANFSWYQRFAAKYGGAIAMYMVSKKLKTRYHMDDEREALYACAEEWMSGIPQNATFMGGDEPNLADLAVYGILRAIESLDTFHDMMTHTTISTWYYAMQRKIKGQYGFRQNK